MCSSDLLIPCRSRQAPVIQRGRVRASIAFMYPRPRKHRLCIHTPACLGYALEPYALREQHEDRARGPKSRQEPPRSHSRIPGRVFPVCAAGGPAQGRTDAQGAARCHAWSRLAADLRRSCRAGSPGAGRSCSRSAPPPGVPGAARSRPDLIPGSPAGVSLSVQLAACLRAAQRPRGRPDAAHGPGWRLIYAAAAALLNVPKNT